jgi:hypothetical protein
LESGLANPVGLTEVTQKREFVQNARDDEHVVAGQPLVQEREGVQDALDSLGQIQQDVGVNGQAQELHGRRGGLRLAGATGGAAAR